MTREEVQRAVAALARLVVSAGRQRTHIELIDEWSPMFPGWKIMWTGDANWSGHSGFGHTSDGYWIAGWSVVQP